MRVAPGRARKAFRRSHVEPAKIPGSTGHLPQKVDLDAETANHSNTLGLDEMTSAGNFLAAGTGKLRHNREKTGNWQGLRDSSTRSLTIVARMIRFDVGAKVAAWICP